MLKGLYIAAGGMTTRLAAQDVISNNLANAGTPGFQREIALVMSRPANPAETKGRAFSPASILETVSAPDRRPGMMQQTGAFTDIALDGAGYLQVRTPAGLRLSRGGTLAVDAQGRLATRSGDAVLGVNGQPIQVGNKEFTVSADGAVTAGGAAAGKLRLVRPVGETRREGASLLASARVQDAPAGSVSVRQGFLERGNVEPVKEMVDMIAGIRAYEAAQRAVTAQDQTLQSLIEVMRTN